MWTTRLRGSSHVAKSSRFRSNATPSLDHSQMMTFFKTCPCLRRVR